MSRAPIPVTTIGGYLGAGKTTLVNTVLSGARGRRIGVLVNDFGAVSIDAALIVARDGDVVTLANGCACCSIAGDLGEALDRLAATSAPEYILVEASGVADPARVASLARAPGLVPHAPVVLADAETIVERAADKFVGKLVRRQLAEAGLVLLTKIDLVDADRLATARDFVRRASPEADVAEAAHGLVDIGLVLDRSASTAARTLQCEAADAPADAPFASHSWSSRLPLDPDRLRAAFDLLPDAIVRAKGVFSTSQGRLMEIHRVGARTSLAARPSQDSISKGADIVFIGAGGEFDRSLLDAAMNDCVQR